MTTQGLRPVIIGHIAGVYGVRGWVRVASSMDPPEAILQCSPWLLRLANVWVPLEVTAGRAHGKGFVAHLAGYDDRDQVRALIGAEVAVPRERLPATGPREFYWADLEGLEVVNAEGVSLGVVDHLLETGANDVLVVAGDRERLIPYIWDRVILDVDLEKGLIRVDWDPEY